MSNVYIFFFVLYLLYNNIFGDIYFMVIFNFEKKNYKKLIENFLQVKKNLGEINGKFIIEGNKNYKKLIENLLQKGGCVQKKKII